MTMKVVSGRPTRFARAAFVWMRGILVNELISSEMVHRRFRWRLLRMFGHDVQRSTISSRVFVGGTGVHIGAGSFVNRGVFIDCAADVWIGSNVSIGQEAMIVTGSHELGGASRRAGRDAPAPVRIDDGCWIGARAIILPGVRIHSGAVVGAGSVVTRDCEPDTKYVGTPARPLGKI
ncbi:DapH/DapD/GlmU-related protein [Microbacterium sp. SMR1]|uniref:acyltransferase n=1 Tax=Microbacterium sp. SMR1 TaxID=1497340 RepID=UPI000DCB66B0|nr:acyltransferase [Microbacterium sp. SMR1]